MIISLLQTRTAFLFWPERPRVMILGHMIKEMQEGGTNREEPGFVIGFVHSRRAATLRKKGLNNRQSAENIPESPKMGLLNVPIGAEERDRESGQ